MRLGERQAKRIGINLHRFGIVLLASLTVIPILYLASLIGVTLLGNHGFGMPYWLYEYRPLYGSRCEIISSALNSFLGFVQHSPVRLISIFAASVMLPILTRRASRKYFRFAMTLTAMSLIADVTVLVSLFVPGPLHGFLS